MKWDPAHVALPGDLRIPSRGYAKAPRQEENDTFQASETSLILRNWQGKCQAKALAAIEPTVCRG